MFKRVNAVLVTVALLLGMFSVCFVTGADASPAFRLAANKIACVGDEWIVDVRVENIPADTGISGIIGEIEFDNDAMTLTDSAVIDSTLTDEDHKYIVPYTDPETGVTKFAFVCEPATKSEEAIIRLTFEISEEAAAGDYTVTVKALEAVDGANDPAEIEGFGEGSATVTVRDYKWGNANMDDQTNSGDAIWILRYVVKMVTDEQIHFDAADVTGDGAVTLGDAVLILRYLAGLYNPYV